MVFKKKEIVEPNKLQTFKEEIVNSISHGLGSLLSIIGFIYLLYSSFISGATTRHIVSCSIYGGSLITMYLNSTIYHAIRHNIAKKVFRRLDHISIYFLIAGTFMPLALVVLQGALGWTVFGIECGLCLIGVLFKAIFGPKLKILSAFFYLLMGWVAVLVIKPIYMTLPIGATLWLLLGGLFYTLGIIFFATDQKFSYFHAIWHFFVLVGSVCHYIMILAYVIPFNS